MKPMEIIAENSLLITKINYDNREGGRYAYLQFMAYTREIISALHQMDGTRNIIRRLQRIQDIFNHLVPLKFDEEHRKMFESKRQEIIEIMEKINRYKLAAFVEPVRQVQEHIYKAA